MNEDRYEIISKFECCGENMIIVKLRGNIHVISTEEWKKIYGKNHPERWNKRKNKYLSKLNNKKLVS